MSDHVELDLPPGCVVKGFIPAMLEAGIRPYWWQPVPLDAPPTNLWQQDPELPYKVTWKASGAEAGVAVQRRVVQLENMQQTPLFVE